MGFKAHASGVSITDIDGQTAIDAVGGLWCVNLGYSNDAVKQAISDQLQQLPNIIEVKRKRAQGRFMQLQQGV